MSATLNAALFAGYFRGCPVVEIPGRAHPVTALYLEDALQARRYTHSDTHSPGSGSLTRIHTHLHPARLPKHVLGIPHGSRNTSSGTRCRPAPPPLLPAVAVMLLLPLRCERNRCSCRCGVSVTAAPAVAV